MAGNAGGSGMKNYQSFHNFDDLKAEFIENMRQRGEHVLSKDCWCDPEVMEVS